MKASKALRNQKINWKRKRLESEQSETFAGSFSFSRSQSSRFCDCIIFECNYLGLLRRVFHFPSSAQKKKIAKHSESAILFMHKKKFSFSRAQLFQGDYAIEPPRTPEKRKRNLDGIIHFYCLPICALGFAFFASSLFMHAEICFISSSDIERPTDRN